MAVEKAARQKVIQYLSEAHAMELALVQTLIAHSMITPAGDYRTGLENHLAVTREHARLVEERLSALGAGRNPLQAGFAAAQATVGQVVAAAKAPVDILRGAGGEENLLKNAKDECATEALEIATYRALASLADAIGDNATAELARRILPDEEVMLAALLEHVERLAAAVAGEDLGADVRSSNRASNRGSRRATAGATRRPASRSRVRGGRSRRPAATRAATKS